MASNFKKVLEDFDVNSKILEFDEGTKTAEQAAKKLGVDIGQIGKSIVFKTERGKFVIVVTSGANRVSEKILEKELNEELVKTNPDEIKSYVGYVIGGIPPFGHDNQVTIFIDRDLLKFDKIFCAAGNPKGVFGIKPKKLIEITSGKVIGVY